MVVFDDLFKTDFEKMNDRDLLNFRKTQIENLFNGDKGSRAHAEREALIQIAEKEIEFRFKKKAEERSNIALLISTVSLLLSMFTFLSQTVYTPSVI
jgi:hypothetical protein